MAGTGAQLPYVYIEKKDRATRFADDLDRVDHLHHDHLEAECGAKDFDKHFEVKAADADFARALVDHTMMESLEAQGTEFVYEVSGWQFVVHTPKDAHDLGALWMPPRRSGTTSPPRSWRSTRPPPRAMAEGHRVEGVPDGPVLAHDRGERLLDVVRVMQRLRGPGGCPWDAEQTHQTLGRHLLEETHETLEAIDAGDMERLKDELGDVLLQVVFHAEMARQEGAWDVDDVAEALARKLIRRHPHVFGDVDVDSAAEVLVNWEKIRRRRRARSAASTRTFPRRSRPSLAPPRCSAARQGAASTGALARRRSLAFTSRSMRWRRKRTRGIPKTHSASCCSRSPGPAAGWASTRRRRSERRPPDSVSVSNRSERQPSRTASTSNP